MYQIKDIGLARSGADKIEWVRSYMPVLNAIRAEFERTQPFAGKKISMSIHLEAKTAYLAQVLRAGGAEVHVTGCNPLSTQDDVAAALAAEGFSVFSHHGASSEEYRADLVRTLSCCPDLIIDDGGDFISLLHGECRALGKRLIGGCEETTTGVHRLRARAQAGLLDYPMMDVNDADCKHLFDNRYGTGQSTLDGIMNSTNLIIAGKTVVVAGYGWCGKGFAMRAKGMGALVIVTEVDPVKAMEAAMDGFAVMPMADAAPLGDLFVTLTGCADVIRAEHMERMKDGVLLANSGHFDVEINKADLERLAVESRERKPNIRGYRMPDGRWLNLLAEGRLVNLAAGNGHPAEIMDLSFALQARCLEYLAAHAAPPALAAAGRSSTLAPGVYAVPADIDRAVAEQKLAAMRVSIDRLSPEQQAYLARVD